MNEIFEYRPACCTDRPLTFEELFARHPLVKDARCFRLSWWPESEPECFSSWEEA